MSAATGPGVFSTAYDRSACDIGVVHLGYGAFHRAHQAVYLDDYMDQSGDLRWGIAAVNLRAEESCEFALNAGAENGYFLKSVAPDGAVSLRRVRAHLDYLDWSENQDAAEALLALPGVHLVTITVTEGGYYTNASGTLDPNDATITAELAGNARRSVYAFLAAGLEQRRMKLDQPISVLCCDNIRQNGKKLRKNLLSYLKLAGQAGLADWTARNVTFPCSMLDRITPRGTRGIRHEIETIVGKQPVAPVMAEGFRMIAGLEDITSGEVSIGDRVVNEVAPSKRGVAMVFQTYALYPHMTVFKNMAFGLKQAKTPQAEIEKRVRAAAEVLQITDYLDRSPRNLSGGQRQRVAIGRAIVRDPEVFLFDEPLSNLDASLRVQTRLEIARLHERLGATMIYVTHDQVEAMTLADKIVVLRDGRIEQIGSPLELYARPQNAFVAQFIGSPKMNFFKPGDLAPGAQTHLPRAPDDTQIIGIRPEHLRSCDPDQAVVSGRVELIEQLGEYVLVHLTGAQGTGFIAKMEHAPAAGKGALLGFGVKPGLVHFFDTASGQRLENA